MENRFLRLIEILTRHDVPFIVVGGIAAVLQRVPVNTQEGNGSVDVDTPRGCAGGTQEGPRAV